MVVSHAFACCNYPCSCVSLLRHKLDIPAERSASFIKKHAKKDPHCKKYGSIFIWYARCDSNAWPTESESVTLSSWATGAYAELSPRFLLSYLRAAGQILIGEDDLCRAVRSVRRAYHAVRLYTAELHGL